MTLELSIEQCLCLPSKVKYASECLIIVQIAGTFGLVVRRFILSLVYPSMCERTKQRCSRI